MPDKNGIQGAQKVGRGVDQRAVKIENEGGDLRIWPGFSGKGAGGPLRWQYTVANRHFAANCGHVIG